MIRHQLENPIRRDGKEIEFAKYVKMHKEQQGPTDPKLIEAVKDEFWSTHTEVGEPILEKIWGFVAPRFADNIGLLEFTKDNDGHKSEFFFPWVMNVFKSPATALEISFGTSPDLSGKWREDIMETDDPIVPFIKDDPAFVYNRERQLFVADLVASVQDLASTKGAKAKVVDFGAGRLAWYRQYGHKIMPISPNIYAFDKDPSIDPTKLFSEELENLGIHYKHGDFTQQLNNPDCREADLIILGGVASYISPDDFSNKIAVAIYQLLKPGGAFFFDLQLDCPCYEHSMDILGWPKFNIPAKVSEIIDRNEAMLRALRQKGLKFSAEYHVDSYNQLPSAVMIVLQKIS